MEQAGLVDGVTALFDYVGPTLTAFVAYASAGELARRLALLSQQTGDPEPVLSWQATRREPTVDVTALDWRLILALRHDAVRPLEDVAEEVGVTYRTAKRRLDPLFRAGAIERSVMLDPGRMPGLLPVELDLRLRDDAPGTLRVVLRAFDDRAVQRFPRAGRRGQHLNLWLFASTLAEAEQLRRSAAALPGVKRAHALLRRGVVYCDAWLDDLIAARAKGG